MIAGRRAVEGVVVAVAFALAVAAPTSLRAWQAAGSGGASGREGAGRGPDTVAADTTGGAVLRTLGLEEALAEARRGNPDLREARLARESAHAAARMAGSALLPGIELDVGLQRSNDPVFAFGTKLRQQRFGAADLALDALNHPSPLNDWSTGVGVRWSVLDPTAWARRAAAGHGATAAGWQAVRAGQGAELSTRVLYWRAVGAEAGVGAARAAEDAARSTVERFRKREERGLLTHADVLRAEAELASARADRVDAERGRDDARSALGLALGWSPDTVPVPSDTLTAPEPPPRAGPTFDAAARADLRARAEVVRADRSRQDAAVASFLPRIEAFAGYQRYADAPFGGDGDAWSAGVMLRWTLFAGLSRPAALAQARAERETAELQYSRARREARAEVSSARRAVEAARRGVEATRAARVAATEARDLMRRRFEEGLMSATDLLAAEARASAARSRAVDALAGYHMALARLRFALGQSTGEEQP
jgi:outer membrane protein TolC